MKCDFRNNWAMVSSACLKCAMLAQFTASPPPQRGKEHTMLNFKLLILVSYCSGHPKIARVYKIKWVSYAHGSAIHSSVVMHKGIWDHLIKVESLTQLFWVITLRFLSWLSGAIAVSQNGYCCSWLSGAISCMDLISKAHFEKWVPCRIILY